LDHLIITADGYFILEDEGLNLVRL
jgi:hypothetical protein